MEIYFILIEPAFPENIGATARAIKTMGFNKLRLVKPVNHLAKEAKWLAHASTEILESAEVFESFEEAINDIDLVVATTAKRRTAKFDYYAATELGEFLNNKRKSIRNVALLFGKEESGLENQIIQKCDIASYIPMKSTYPSLNLAQAVMIFAYELSNSNIYPDKLTKPNINDAVYKTLKTKLKELLREINIDQNSNLYHRILERSASMSDDDIHLALSVLNKL